MSIYADNAAQKPLTKAVKQTLMDCIIADYCNPSAIYTKARKTQKAFEEARQIVAECIGADSDEIFFTSGSTEAINWVASLAKDFIIITSNIEHKALIKAFSKATVATLPVNGIGYIDIDDLRYHCNFYKKECMVTLGWVNNEIGTIQPIQEIADICHQTKAKLFLDATQAIGKVPINVHEIGVDYLCGSFHKLGGLAGSGFLYIKKGACIDSFIQGGSQERGMRAGTENLFGALCGATAIKEATKDIDIRMLRYMVIQNKIVTELCKLPKTHLNGILGNRVETNINICFEGIDAESLVLMLDIDGIEVSTGSACNSHNIEPSYVLKAIGLTDEEARASIRITFEDITDQEVDYLIDHIKYRVTQLREKSPLWSKIKE